MSHLNNTTRSDPIRSNPKMSERPQRTCTSKYRREIVVEDQMVEEVIQIDTNLVPKYTNDWDFLCEQDETIETYDEIIVPDTPAAALTITTLPDHSPSTPSLPNVTPSTPFNPFIVHKRQDNGVNDSIDRLLCIVEAQQNSIAELIRQNQNQQMKHQLQQLALQKQTERLESLIEKLDNKQQIAAPNVHTLPVQSTSTTSLPTKPKETPPTSVKKKSSKAPERKRIEIFGDSMIGGVKPQYMSAKNNYKIHSYGGGTSEDMVDLVKIGMRRKPEVVILHSGSNDITSTNVNTIQMIEKTIKYIKQEQPNTNIGISLICPRNDQHKNKNPQIKDMNNKIKNLCRQHSIGVIEHPTFDTNCLSTVKNTARGKRGGLHPNGTGNSVLAKDFMNYVDNL